MIEEIMKWLNAIGSTVSSFISLPKWWVNVGPKVFRLDQDLPQWAMGLVIVIVLLLVLKIVTNILFKIALTVGLVILLLILLSALNAPVGQWLSSFNW
ncbi:MAG: hypothetical protein WC621_04660 [Patescibacteria group bacterium]